MFFLGIEVWAAFHFMKLNTVNLKIMLANSQYMGTYDDRPSNTGIQGRVTSWPCPFFSQAASLIRLNAV